MVASARAAPEASPALTRCPDDRLALIPPAQMIASPRGSSVPTAGTASTSIDDALWAAITSVEDFSAWWPWLRGFDGERLAVGETWDCTVQPPLPYSLHFDLEIDEVVPYELVTARVSGDLDRLRPPRGAGPPERARRPGRRSG